MNPGMTLTAQQEQLQRAEMMRNKGIICKQYFSAKSCKRSNCPFAHIFDGEVRPLPDAPCLFFQQGVCLREKCKYFHGPKKDYDSMKAAGQTMYRPQEFMPVAHLPTDPTLVSQQSPEPVAPHQMRVASPARVDGSSIFPTSTSHQIQMPIQQFLSQVQSPPLQAAHHLASSQQLFSALYPPQAMVAMPSPIPHAQMLQGNSPMIFYSQGGNAMPQHYSYVSIPQPPETSYQFQGTIPPYGGGYYIPQ